MKLSKIFQKMCVGVATVGLLVPQAGIVRGAEQVVAAKQSKVKIVDVSLADGGVLKGQVISPQGKAIAQTPGSLHQGKAVVAKTTANAAGEFSCSGGQVGA